jgi:hypothetical protein
MVVKEDELELACCMKNTLESGEGEWLARGGRRRFFI